MSLCIALVQHYPLLDQFPAPLIPACVLSCGVGTVPHQASSRGLTDLLAFLFISLSPGCKCNTKGTISGIAECQQVGLLLSASRHLRAYAVLGLFQLCLSQQLLGETCPDAELSKAAPQSGLA